MMDIRSAHSDAMDLAEKAEIARARGEEAAYRRFLKRALAKEVAAANLAVEQRAPEPTRSILLRSAAHLAVDSGDYRAAEKLVSIALSGDPPEEIAQELRSLFEEIGFGRHLHLQGIKLHPNDVQMVLVGHAVAPGMAASDEFISRVGTFQKMLYRTSESDQGRPYRERGDPKQVVERPLQLFVSVPRAASFAVSLKVASESQQGEFPFAESVRVIDHLVDRLQMYDREDFESLHNAIPAIDYFENFVELAAELAPDGERVRLVGFTTLRDGVETRFEMKRAVRPESKAQKFVPADGLGQLIGRVFFMNIKDEENPIIKLETEDGNEWRLKADQEQLQKAVRYAATLTRVVATGKQVTRTTFQVEKFRAVRRKSKER